MLFVKLMEDGGPVLWIILACTLLALFVFLAKVFQFHREEINVTADTNPSALFVNRFCR